MRENQDKKLEKWNSEIGVLQELKTALEEYATLKDEKGEKDKIDTLNAKIANLIEDNSWTRLEWGVIKRGKQSRAEGLDKIEKRIKDRQKKIDEHIAEKAETPEAVVAPDGLDTGVLRAECEEGDIYQHLVYGEMEVLAVEGDYIYLKILDKKGVRDGWPNKNNAVVQTEEGLEEVKEFPRNALGTVLFPKDATLTVGDALDITPHKMYKGK